MKACPPLVQYIAGRHVGNGGWEWKIKIYIRGRYIPKGGAERPKEKGKNQFILRFTLL